MFFLNNYYFLSLKNNNYLKKTNQNKKIINKSFKYLNIIKISKFIFLINLDVLKENVKNYYLFGGNVYVNIFSLKHFYNNIKMFYDFIFFSVQKKNNFLILENNNYVLYPFYNYLYKNKNLYTYKNFFFIKPNYFTYRNWIYFYESFLHKFDIKILIIFDITNYINYLKDIKSLNTFLISLVFIDNIFIKIDICLFTNNSFFFVLKYIYFVILFNSFFLSMSFKNSNFKLIFLN